MTAPSLTDIEQLSIAERIQLAEDIWDTVAASPEQVTVTPAQQSELDRRVESYRQNSQAGASWQEVNGGLRLRCFATSPLRTPTLRAGHEPRP